VKTILACIKRLVKRYVDYHTHPASVDAWTWAKDTGKK